MKTAVDSSVLLDVLGADPRFGERSREALRAAYSAGALIACDVVWAEVRAHFGDDQPFEETMTTLGITFSPLSRDAARLAGALWRQHRSRRRPETPRARVVADLLIGAHASLDADELLTRDRGFYRACFASLKIRDPSENGARR